MARLSSFRPLQTTTTQHIFRTLLPPSTSSQRVLSIYTLLWPTKLIPPIDLVTSSLSPSLESRPCFPPSPSPLPFPPLITTMMLITFSRAIVALGAILFLNLLSRYRKMLLNSKAMDVPSRFFLFPLPLRLLLPNIPYLNPLNEQDWTHKFAKYTRMGSTSIIKFNCLFTRLPILFVANAQAAKQISINRKVWSKPIKMYKGLGFFGANLVITEGPIWKTHRKIVGPSFTESAYSLVWNETADTFSDMLVSEGWESAEKGTEIKVKDFVEVTMRLALLVIGRAAFGIPMAWKDDDASNAVPLANNHTMTSSHALSIVSETTIQRMLVPKFVYKLPIPRLQPFLTKMDTAFKELDSHMMELVQERRAREKRVLEGKEDAPEKEDLFGSLVRAAAEEREDDGIPFGDREVIGNTFIFLLAGHETSGHTLAFLFVLLALNPLEQVKLQEHVESVLPNGRKPVYEDFQKLTHVLNTLYETMRLFPPVVAIPKTADEDTTLVYQSSTKDEEGNYPNETVFVPKGTDVMIDTPSLHTNPMYWDEPDLFRPSRFEDYNKDAFMPFSAGPRACVGRRFAEVEAVCAIALFIQKFEFVAVPHVGESHEGMSKRLLRAKMMITLTPHDVDLVLRRR
ncbi:cytochrome P450 [Mrakia frigida]|uniref:cytochrome P450 n=1 Tax=Mrakia frigida TaxID=29902 RepID=UPI003FCC1E09